MMTHSICYIVNLYGDYVSQTWKCSCSKPSLESKYDHYVFLPSLIKVISLILWIMIIQVTKRRNFLYVKSENPPKDKSLTTCFMTLWSQLNERSVMCKSYGCDSKEFTLMHSIKSSCSLVLYIYLFSVLYNEAIGVIDA